MSGAGCPFDPAELRRRHSASALTDIISAPVARFRAESDHWGGEWLRMTRYVCALFACWMLVSAGHAAERRVALVIGNSAYKDAPLINPGNDARAVSQALRESGFTVMERRNLNQAALRRAIREFGDELIKGGVGVFFYAGHGMQVRGRNYLIPVGHDIRREDEVADQSVDVGLVLEKMGTARNALNILILDACRNNPFGGPGGLAPLDAPAGTLIAFATAPGQVADDGSGDNGLYTKHLVSYMREPGLKVEDVFKRVRSAVRQESAGKQTSWENTSLEVDFYFKALDARVIAEQNREREQIQKEAIEKAVQDALQRSGQQTARDRAAVERQIAERVAVERVAAEKAAAERIAAMEKALQVALSRSVAPAPSVAPVALPGAAAVTRPQPAPAAAPRPAPQEPTRLAMAAPSSAAIAGASAAAAFKVGDNWVYKATDRDYTVVRERKTVLRVESVTDREVHIRAGSKNWLRYTPEGNLIASLPRDGIERRFEPTVPLYSFPLEPGKTWQTKYRTTRSDGRVFDNDRSVTVVGWEEVKVPAGTFRALKISSLTWYRRVDSGGSGGGRSVFNYWYAPEVKRLIKSETLETGNNNVVYQDNTFELVSYKVQ